MDYQKLLIENIKYYRSLLGYTQAQLAEAANVSKSAIGQIESGKNTPSFELQINIANALQIEPHLLLKVRKYPTDDNIPDPMQLVAEMKLLIEKNKKDQDSRID
ncbi:MAG: helix-turn-helix transcriptional regulator [Spirochaetales bacterium]|nr:helix-turn-helix transcriptional regulator [Spirochaetales bacterium]